MNVFDPDYLDYCVTKTASVLSDYQNDNPYILGIYSDNEICCEKDMLYRYLTIDPTEPVNAFSYATAWTWLMKRTGNPNAGLSDITDKLSEEFKAFVYNRYFYGITRAVDAAGFGHYMYLGNRIHQENMTSEGYLRAAAKYVDVLTCNLYGGLTPKFETMEAMYKYTGKPFIVTEWYAKGMDVWEADERMTNQSGAGWTVKNQNDRGIFYQNYALQLLECKGCVGFDWFRYLDNDPDDLTADETNRNANKGIIDNNCNEYTELTAYMGELNNQKYNLINYFDQR
jgi:hypothetical protein